MLPELNEAQRIQLAKANFEALGRSILDRGIIWWGSRERILRLIKVDGEEKLHALLAAKRPIILLVPHFFGLDAGAMAMSMRFDVVTIYAPQRNAVFERVFYKGRRRFGNQLMLTRQDGARATVKAMKSGRPFYYLPDLNYRRRDSIFVPFLEYKRPPSAACHACPKRQVPPLCPALHACFRVVRATVSR